MQNKRVLSKAYHKKLLVWTYIYSAKTGKLAFVRTKENSKLSDFTFTKKLAQALEKADKK